MRQPASNARSGRDRNASFAGAWLRHWPRPPLSHISRIPHSLARFARLAFPGRSGCGRPARVLSGFMADEQLPATDPRIAAVVAVLLAVLVAVVALAAGLSWERLLHFAAVVLLLAGILAAAKGIRDVRLAWTSLPGLAGRLATARERAWGGARQAQARIAGSGFGRLLRLPPPVTRVHLADGGVAMSSLRVSAGGTVRWGKPPEGCAVERLAWLEAHLLAAEERLVQVEERQLKDVGDHAAVTEEERRTREAADQRLRDDMADLAGGGLRLQAWSVALLIAGTILTAFY